MQLRAECMTDGDGYGATHDPSSTRRSRCRCHQSTRRGVYHQLRPSFSTGVADGVERHVLREGRQLGRGHSPWVPP